MKNQKIYYVYLHLRLTDNKVFYVGMGKGNRDKFKTRPRNKHWLNIVNKYSYYVLRYSNNLDFKEACLLEIKMIKYYGLENLSNMTKGGEGSLGLKMTTLQKEKLSKKLLSLNMKRSDETKAKISKANTGKIKSLETRAKISKANTGQHVSIETRAKLSKIHKGRKVLNLHNYGNTYRLGVAHTIETRAKISKSHKGKIFTIETRAKISKANTGSNNGMSKKLLQFDSNMKLIKEYFSITNASKITGFSLSTLGKRINSNKLYKNFYWIFK